MLKYTLLIMMLAVQVVQAEAKNETTGYLSNAKQVGLNIWIGPQPSEDDFNEFAAQEVTVVVNTRTQEEMDKLGYNEAKRAGQFDMSYALIEVGQGHAYSPVQLQAFNELMVANSGEKMVFHCRSGHRASQMYAAWLVKYQHMSAADALKAIDSDETVLNDSIKALLGQ